MPFRAAHARRPRFVPALLVLLAVAATACEEPGDLARLREQELTATRLPASPTNAFADAPDAAALGRALFFDERLSVDGTISCASCHAPESGFSDPRPFSIGVRGQVGDRHAMPITAVAFQAFTLWDGRGDSLWSQPLQAIENEKEMDLTRAELVHRVAEGHRSAYEAIFGPLPELAAVPARAKPGMAAWAALPEGLQVEIDGVAANVGKAIEAYERTVTCEDTRFDRWARGELELSAAEEAGGRTFVAQGCIRCHNGPAFSDGKFHNVGVPSNDPGRSVGRDLLLENPFNGAGSHSDDPQAGAAKLAAVPLETRTLGAFRTPSLRGVGQRRFFGHASHEATLRGFITDIYRRGGRGGRGDGDGGGRGATIGALDPLLDGVNVPPDQVDDVVAFLRTLDCPPPTQALLAP